MVKLVNRARMSTSTTGTGTITLGSAENGYQSFTDAGVPDGDVVRYVIEDGADWEIGTGTYTVSGTTLSRSVTESSNADAPLNLSGNAVVFIGAAAQDFSPTITLAGDASGSVTLTDLENATLTVTVVDDSHNHVIANVDGLQADLDAKLDKSGGAMTGAITTNSTFDGVDVGARDAVLTSTTTTANAALPKAGGAMTGPITTNSTFDGVDIASRDAVLTSTTTTANNALPKAGGAMTGAITTSSTFDGRSVATDGAKLDNITVTQAVDLDQMEIDIAALANGMVYKGDWDASASTFPGSGSAQVGWFYYVSVAGTVGGISFAVGDNIVAIVDDASTSTYASNWSKHDQTDAVTSVVGLNGSITKSGLLSALNVEDGADVTDATNVTAAGALMDSEVTNLAQVKAFDSTDYATAAQGSTADAALPKSGGAMTGAITTNSTFDGRDVAVDGTKLDGIEASADVTDTTNVTAAGALMDSEVTNLAQVKAFASSDYATAAQGTAADNALPKSGGAMTGAITTNSTFDGVDIATRDGVLTSTTNTANAALPKSGGAMTGAITTSSTFDGRDVATDGAKLDGIESGATADQTDAEIRAAVEAATDSNVFTDADHTKLNAIAAGATNVTNNNQLTNGAGYTTNVGDITGVTAGTNLTGGGTSGSVTLNVATSPSFSGVVFAESVQEDYDALSGTSPAPDADNAGGFSLTMTGNTTFSFGGVTSGRAVGFILELTGNGSTVTWPSTVDWAGGTAPDAPASGESNLYVFYTRDGGSNWVGTLSAAAYA